MWQRFLSIVVAGLCLCLFCACKSDTPDGVIPQGKMKDILYDYHLAQALAQQAPADSINYLDRLYKQAVWAKYGITKQDFDRSMQWYQSNGEQLADIYKSLVERMGDSVGEAVGTAELNDLHTVSGDTVNVWQGPETAMLYSQGENRFVHSEELAADTLLRGGDDLRWRFRTDWYYHEGERKAVACMIVHYKGDSIATTRQNIYSSGLQHLNMRVADRKVIRIECFVYQDAPWTARPRIIRLSGMSVQRVRRHELPRQSAREIKPDSMPEHRHILTPEKRIQDSLLRQDTLNRRRSHFR